MWRSWRSDSRILYDVNAVRSLFDMTNKKKTYQDVEMAVSYMYVHCLIRDQSNGMLVVHGNVNMINGM